jgi:hypothetical protein
MTSTPASPARQTAAAIEFVKQWTGKGYEKGQTQAFWLHLLRVLGAEAPESAIEFEDAARMDEVHGFIDAYIPSTHVLVEQKSLDRNLRAPIRQSDGTSLTPFQQARRYAATLPYSRRPRWIVTCNFAEFLVYDMENPNAEPESVRLADLPGDLYRLHFLVNTASDRVAREMEVSIEAGRIVGDIYDALLAQYGDPTPEVLHWLNVLCVRLVFCLYAEDAGIFADDQFHDYLATIPTHRLRQALLDLFAVLDTPKEGRSRYLDAGLAAFPYVNGSLFSGPVEIPQFTEALRTTLLEKASLGFDWSEISPTIFGAVFESTLNPETRRSGGMHYTSIENIHKVVDPLFLDDLRAELTAILEIPVPKQRDARLRSFQDKLASLTFLDPACGSGNFLTETYLSLRRLENEAIAALIGKQSLLDLEGNPVKVKVSIGQFYGLEINDFAVSVAKTALWIAESQMLAQTAVLLHRDLDFLPLKSYANIREGNALRMDWQEGAPRPFDYIIGNPPFVGKKEQNREQKADLISLFSKEARGVGNLDYVSGWYKKALGIMKGTRTQAAFVSTNSITQGEQVPILWRELQKDDIHILFAHRTFRWDSESSEKAHVHCVIVGFSCFPPSTLRPLYDGPRCIRVPRINPYLLPADDLFIDKRSKPLCSVPEMLYGSMPIDDGHLILSREERDTLLTESPANARFVRRYAGGDEIINARDRWCLWLADVSPAELRRSPFIMERLRLTKQFRESSNRPQTLKLADTPHLFGEIRQPSTPMLVVPKVSSEHRRYIPITFVQPDIIVNGSALIVPDASLFEFGVLISNVHMAWMRTVAGRLETRYQYSAANVYNNFPWPTPTAAQQARIEATAKGILDARAAHPESTLADLYDELTMPPDLRKAHRANDKAVMEAYGFPVSMTESDCVAALFRLYQSLAERP